MNGMQTEMTKTLRDAVMSVLTDVFGEPKTSLCLNKERRLKADTCYFYRLKDTETPKDLLAYLQTHYPAGESFPLDGMRYPLEENNGKPTEREVYAEVSDRELGILIRFFTMEGVRIHRLYGKQIVASLYSVKRPVFIMGIHPTGIIDTYDGKTMTTLKFSWWVNKLMRENETVRSVMIGLLRISGKQSPIIQTVARTLEKDHFFLPQIDMEEMLSCKTPAELIEKAAGGRLDIDYDKTDLNIAYYLTCFRDQFDKQEGIRLTDYPQDDLLYYIELEDLYEGPSATRFLKEHYYHLTEYLEKWELRDVVDCYFDMCKDHGRLPRILPTYDKFTAEYEELAGSYPKRRVLSTDNMDEAVSAPKGDYCGPVIEGFLGTANPEPFEPKNEEEYCSVEDYVPWEDQNTEQ